MHVNCTNSKAMRMLLPALPRTGNEITKPSVKSTEMIETKLLEERRKNSSVEVQKFLRNGAEVHWHSMLMSAFLKIPSNLLLHGIYGREFLYPILVQSKKKLSFIVVKRCKNWKIWLLFHFQTHKFWFMTKDRMQTSFIFTDRNDKNKHKWIPTTKISFEDFFIWCNSFHSPPRPNEKEKENQIQRLTYGNYWFICGPK